MSTYSRNAKLILGGICSLGIGFASVNFLPNTFFIDTLQEVVQMYRNGLPVTITEEVSRHLELVMNDMQINSEDRELIHPFTVYGYDVFNAGSVHTKFGAIVGIPSNFNYKCVDDVETDKIMVRNRRVDWTSSCAHNLKESLILSDEARKFLIAREIAYIRSPAVFLKSIYPVTTAFMLCTLAHKFSTKLHLSQKPPIFHSILYVILCLFGFGTWAFLQDFTTVQLELQADKTASELGKEYARGGLEVYSKLIQRNISLRELMGSNGPSTYTPTGNDKYFFRQKHVPFSHRKLYMEQIVNAPNPEEKLKHDHTMKIQNALRTQAEDGTILLNDDNKI